MCLGIIFGAFQEHSLIKLAREAAYQPLMRLDMGATGLHLRDKCGSITLFFVEIRTRSGRAL